MRKRSHRQRRRHRSLLAKRAPRPASWAALAVVVLALGGAMAAPLLGRHLGQDESGAGQVLGRTDDPIVIEGFAGPESVRFDRARGVWYVGNFNGSGNARDDNGLISRVLADGTLDTLTFVDGGRDDVTLHAPRGMYVVGDTLWVCDVDAIRGFDTRTGAFVAAVDMTRWDPGFLNDIAADDSGSLYVTDTGRQRIYRIRGREATIALEDSVLGMPNGIAWHPGERRFIVVPFDGSRTLLAWRPGQPPEPWRTLPSGGRYDGVEILRDGRVVLASQTDSSVYVLAADPEADRDSVRVRIRVQGAPADLGVDENGGRIGVPYIARNLIELWPLERP